MSIVVRLSPTNVTRERYDEVASRLSRRGCGQIPVAPEIFEVHDIVKRLTVDRLGRSRPSKACRHPRHVAHARAAFGGSEQATASPPARTTESRARRRDGLAAGCPRATIPGARGRRPRPSKAPCARWRGGTGREHRAGGSRTYVPTRCTKPLSSHPRNVE
jgi:hypothetical protein